MALCGKRKQAMSQVSDADSYSISSFKFIRHKFFKSILSVDAHKKQTYLNQKLKKILFSSGQKNIKFHFKKCPRDLVEIFVVI